MPAVGDAEVSIVYRHVPQYRREFYELLRRRLAADGVTLRLVHGQPVGADATKGDAIQLPWATGIRNRSIGAAGKHLVWQPVWPHVRRSDLVIAEQASKLLVNYLLLGAQRLGGPSVALWGHGVNLQADGRSITRASEQVKRRASATAHWFFAYTEGVAERLRRAGYPGERITVTQNAVDTRALRLESAGATEEDCRELRRELGLGSAPVGLFLGSVYAEKRPGYLLAAADELRRILGDFHLVVAGGGPDLPLLEDAGATRPWIHVLGPVFGRRKAVLGRLADVLLMPGLVGLVVLDAFALGTPLVTTAIPYHSPEFEYLRHGDNGLVLPAPATPEDYAAAVAELLRRPDLRARLTEGCRASADRYTVEEMTDRYAAGVLAALRTPARAG